MNFPFDFQNILCILCSFYAYCEAVTIFGQNFGFRPSQHDFGPGAPDRIYRAKISVTGYKHIMQVRFSGRQVFDVYNFRARWTDPAHWRDENDDSKRKYELVCWVELDGKQRIIVQRFVPATFTGYNEKLRFPPEMDVHLQCKVRAHNSLDLSTSWSFTNLIKALDVPVYLPGLIGVNVKGLDAADIASILDNVASEISRDSEIPEGSGEKAIEEVKETPAPRRSPVDDEVIESGSGEEPFDNQQSQLNPGSRRGVPKSSSNSHNKNIPPPISNSIHDSVLEEEGLTLDNLDKTLRIRRERQRAEFRSQLPQTTTRPPPLLTSTVTIKPTVVTQSNKTIVNPDTRNLKFEPYRHLWQVEERELRRVRMKQYLDKLDKESNYDQDFRLLRARRRRLR